MSGCKLIMLLMQCVYVQGAEAGAVDGYLEQVLPVMEADLFGEIAEAKEADVFAAKYRQVTACGAVQVAHLVT